MIHYRSEEEIDLIRESSLLVAKTHAEISALIKPGVTTLQLDGIAEEFIRDNGGVPAFKGYGGFPNTLCASLNEQVVHGIPNDKLLNDGDIISMDCGVFMNGYYGDSAYTYEVGNVSEEVRDLLIRTKESLYKGIDQAVSGNRIGDIGFAIQRYVEQFGYGVVRELVGHGIGTKLHEEPQIPNYGSPNSGPKIVEGMCLAIEPMINMGEPEVYTKKDGWTVCTKDGLPSAHFEHTITITETGANILT